MLLGTRRTHNYLDPRGVIFSCILLFNNGVVILYKFLVQPILEYPSVV